MTFISDSTEVEYSGKDMEEAYQMGRKDAIDKFNNKVNDLRNHYVDACNMCTKTECDVCDINDFIDDLEQLKEQKNDDCICNE